MSSGNLFGLWQKALATVERFRPTENRLKLKGKWYVEHFNKSGLLIGRYDFNNDITNAGKNDIFGVYFFGGTQTAAANWFIGLISSTGFSGLAASDTMASHGGWTEFTGYSGSNRIAWGPGAPASQSISNPTPDQFNINATGTVKGVFVVNNSTISGTTGILWATALFSSDVPVKELFALFNSNVEVALGYLRETPSIQQYALAA